MYPVYFVQFYTGLSIDVDKKIWYYKKGYTHINKEGVTLLAYSEAQKKAVKKYNEKSYDEIKLRVKKGNKDIIQKHAASKNETVNGLLNRLLEKEIPEITK